MENSQTLSTKLQQTQQLSTQQLHSLELLSLPLLALEQTLSSQLIENPLLEMEFPESENVEIQIESSFEEENSGDDDAWKEDMMTMDNDYWMDNYDFLPKLTSSDLANEAHDYMLNSISQEPPAIQEELHSEISADENISEEVKNVSELLISMLDEHGFLNATLEEIAMNENLSLDVLDEALEFIQSFEPAGIGARNIGECLKLQLIRDGENDPIYTEILDNHLDDIANNHLPFLARNLNISLEELNERITFLSKYSPYPAMEMTSNKTQYITPELQVYYDDFGDLKIRLLTNRMPRLFLSERYVNMLMNEELSTEEKTYLRDKIHSAKELIKAFELRKSTLERIGEILLDTQKDFFENGVEFLKPLTMREVGDILELHETTISRAVAEKYVQSPNGTYPLKYFFSAGINKNDGQSVSNKAIKEIIREEIKKENPVKPLSDEAISKFLKSQGFNIARRTVAKYRESMNIPATNLRRKHI